MLVLFLLSALLLTLAIYYPDAEILALGIVFALPILLFILYCFYCFCKTCKTDIKCPGLVFGVTFVVTLTLLLRSY